MEFTVLRRVLTRIVEERRLKILVVPTSDWLGHPFPSRLHHIFEKIAEHNEVHVLRFPFYPREKLKTNLVVHESEDIKTDMLALYYTINAHKHFNSVRRIVKENQFDVVVISNLLSGYMAAKAVGNQAKMIFDLSDHFPSSGAGYYFKTESILGRIVTCGLEKLLKATLKQVDYTVTCSHALKDYVKRLNVDAVGVVPNGVDDFFFRKNHEKEIREKYGLYKGITVGYLGSVEFWLDLSPLLKAIRVLSKSYDVKLILVGAKLRTKFAQQVNNLIERLGIKEHVLWLDFVPYHEVPSYIGAMDICVIPFRVNHPTAFYSAPNKLWEYLALGKKVIATPIPEIVKTAKQFVDFAETTEDYVSIVEDYIKNHDENVEMVQQAKKLAMRLTWTNIAKRYEEILKKTFSSNAQEGKKPCR